MGRARKMWIEGPAGRLEATLRDCNEPRAAAVLAHPHPLYGGSMHNPVIFHADRRLNRAGWATLRFNFRGVGGSDGMHDNGLGEIDDVAAAVSWLCGAVGKVRLFVIGYSFGSWCGLRYAVDDAGVAGLVAIGLPVRIYAFDEMKRFSRPVGVVQGSRDEFGTPEEVRRAVAGAQPPVELRVVEGADHLFQQRAPEAAEEVVGVAEACLALPHDP